MTRKADIKQFRQACAELRMSARERREASIDLHTHKQTAGMRGHMSYGDLLAWLRQWQRGALMATAVGLDSSPANVLRSMRGPIIDARVGHPDSLHVEIEDAAGERWLLATQDAEWTPTDPSELVEDAQIDETTGELLCKLSNGSLLDVKPARKEADDDPPNWELITPRGVLLEFGPGVRWQISSADEPASSRR